MTVYFKLMLSRAKAFTPSSQGTSSPFFLLSTYGLFKSTLEPPPMQIHLHGQYSVERAFALDEYTRRTSFSRVILVCFATVVPSLAGILAFDAVPLRDPSEGWDHNGMMWFRLFGGVFMFTVGILLQLTADVPAAALSIRQCIVISLFTAAGYVAVGVLIAKYWVYPIPFGFFILMPSWCFLFILSVVFAIGVKNIRKKPELQTQLSAFYKQMRVASCFLPIYLGYNVVFLRLTSTSRLAFVIVLPVIKIILKRIVAKVAVNQVDRMPSRVASVDVFNAMYQSKCMQATGSTWATAVIIGIDVVQNVYSIHRLTRHMEHIEALAKETGISPTNANLLGQVIEALAEPELLDSRSVVTLRTRSCTKVELKAEKVVMIQRIEAAQARARKRSSFTANKPNSTSKISRQSTSTSAVVPSISIQGALSSSHLASTAVSRNQITPLSPAQEGQKNARAIAATLELIWKCELLLLVEYIEAAIPLLYAIYLSILYYLPNAKFYPGISEMTQDQVDSAIGSILLYAGLETASLVFVHVILKWKFNFSVLHQLAFVFETDWALIQGVLIGWVVVVLQFTLAHYGTLCSFYRRVSFYRLTYSPLWFVMSLSIRYRLYLPV